jgi:type VI secretion system protein ImpL
VFAFPQQMAALRDLLNGFISDVFVSTRFDRQILLRGVYFTSGTQEGNPIDRLLGALARRFAVAPDAVAPAGRGKAYFIERMLKGVLLEESGLAGVNRRLEMQKAAVQLGAYAAVALVAVLALVALTTSYNRNRAYVDSVAGAITTLENVPRTPAGAVPNLTTLLPRLDALGAVADAANRYRDDTPWSMRWGLYQGNGVGDAARAAYSRELNGALLPTLVDRIQQRLVDAAAEPEKLYLYLKAYLMLNLPEHLDKMQLGYLAEQEWQTAYGNDSRAVKSLTNHFNNLLAYNSSLRKMPIDQALVDGARRTIPSDSIPALIYSFIKISYADDAASALRFDTLGIDRVFRRKSGTSLAQPMPTLYTAKAFEQVVSTRADETVQQFIRDRWVWGDSRPSNPVDAAQLKARVIDQYERDYIRAWDSMLSDMGLVSIDGTENLKRALRAWAVPRRRCVVCSRRLMTIRSWYGSPTRQSPAAYSQRPRRRSTGFCVAGNNTSGCPAGTPGAQITQHFAPIPRLVAGAAGSAPIDRLVDQIKQLQEKLEPIGSASGRRSATSRRWRPWGARPSR